MQLFAIYGNPVAHSKSPQLHNSVFESLGMRDAAYIRIRLEDGGKIKENFMSLGLSGANVTVPFKEDAYSLCDEVKGLASKIRAVNTLVNEGGRLVGYNTDCDGFMASLSEFENVKSAVILGAGGTARAIAFALRDAGIAVHLINRSEGRLGFFRENGFEAATWKEFTTCECDVIINTTSAGLEDDSLPAPDDLLEKLLEGATYAHDVIYNKETPFLSFAMKHGLIFKDGKDMLVGQAVHAFMKFTGRKDFAAIKAVMDKAIEL